MNVISGNATNMSSIEYPASFAKLKLPKGWLQCKESISQTIMDDLQLVVCKTPIDNLRSNYWQIPQNKRYNKCSHSN